MLRSETGRERGKRGVIRLSVHRLTARARREQNERADGAKSRLHIVPFHLERFADPALSGYLLLMKEQKLSRVVIDDPRRARVFTDPKLRRILLWFTRTPKAANEAAIALGMDLRRLHYHLGRLTALGLLREVGQQRRPGRPIRLYRAAGDSFFIAHDAVTKGFGDDLAAELRGSLNARLGLYGGGILFSATAQGAARGRIVRAPEGVADAFEAWRILRLTPGDLAALRQELNAVLNRFQRRSGGGGRIYLVNAAAAPRLAGERAVDNPA